MMHKLPFQVLLLLGLLALAACGGAPRNAGPPAPSATATLPPNPLNVYFSTDAAPKGTQGVVYALSGMAGKLLWHHESQANVNVNQTPVLDHGVVYVGSDMGLDALNAQDGKLLWSHPAPGSSVLGIVGGMVYATNSSSLYALNASDGSLRWKYQTKDRLTAEMVANGVIYATGFPPPPCQCGAAGPLYTLALSASDGALLWKTPPDATYHYEVQAATPGLVYGLNYDGVTNNLLVRHASDGSVAWHFPNDPASASVSIIGLDGNMIAVLSNEGPSSQVVYALDASSGSILWHTQIMNDTELMGALIDHVIYVGSSNNYKPLVYAINEADGRLLWHTQLETDTTPIGLPAMAVAVINGAVYLAFQQDFAALSASDGSLKWQYQTNGYTIISAVAYGVVYGSATATGTSGTPEFAIYALNASSGTRLWQYNAPVAFNTPVAVG